MGCSIKDSFVSLDMAAYGFRVLCAKPVSKRGNARQLASPLRQAKRCSALAFCARSRIGKVREIGRYGAFSVSCPQGLTAVD